jgi:dimethylargininase
MPIATWTRPLSLGRRIAASLITGLGVAAVAHLATVLVFFASNGASAANIVPISNYFLPGSLALFVLAALASYLGANRFWFTAAIGGLMAAIIAAAVGTSYGILSTGNAWSSQVWDFVVASLVGNNLIFIVAGLLSAIFVGRKLWRVASRWLNASQPLALVRQPSSRLKDGELTHRERVAVNQDLADEQWDAYIEALEDNGFETVEVAEADDLPDSVFIEDALVVLGGTAIVTSPGAESRRDETAAAAATAKRLGFAMREIELPGTLDGGDVLTVGDTIYVGASSRTNAEGIAQLRAIATALGYSVVAVAVTKALHLKSTVTALPDGTIIGFPKLIDNPQVFSRFVAVPEAAGAAVVVLGTDAVLMAASAPKSAALIESLGYRVVTVDISEFEKLEGCVTCLSVRVA